MFVYKFTDRNMKTANGYFWEIGKKATIDENDPTEPLCNQNWLHSFVEPIISFAQLHMYIRWYKYSTRLFLAYAEGNIKTNPDRLKIGSSSLTLLKELELPTNLSLCNRIINKYYFNKFIILNEMEMEYLAGLREMPKKSKWKSFIRKKNTVLYSSRIVDYSILELNNLFEELRPFYPKSKA